MVLVYYVLEIQSVFTMNRPNASSTMFVLKKILILCVQINWELEAKENKLVMCLPEPHRCRETETRDNVSSTVIHKPWIYKIGPKRFKSVGHKKKSYDEIITSETPTPGHHLDWGDLSRV